MRHASEGELQAYLDEELSGEARAALKQHVAACAECAAQLEALRGAAERFAAALSLLDPTPATAAAHSAVLSRRAERRPLELRRSLLRAAMLVLGLAAVGSAAVPGSPVRAWLVAAWERLSGAPVEQPPEAASTTNAVTRAPTAGVSILPLDGRVRVLVIAPAADARIRVRFVEGERAAVEATSVAASTRFRTGPGRIEVLGAAGEILVTLPRGAGVAALEINGQLYVASEAGRVRVFQAADSVAGDELVFRPR